MIKICVYTLFIFIIVTHGKDTQFRRTSRETYKLKLLREIAPRVFKRSGPPPATFFDMLMHKAFGPATSYCNVQLGNFICGQFGRGDTWWMG